MEEISMLFFSLLFFVGTGIQGGNKSGSGINIPGTQHLIELNEL
jgi:hypothetical protein